MTSIKLIESQKLLGYSEIIGPYLFRLYKTFFELSRLIYDGNQV